MLGKKHSPFPHCEGHDPLNDLLSLGDRWLQGSVYFKTVPVTGFGPGKSSCSKVLATRWLKNWGSRCYTLFCMGC